MRLSRAPLTAGILAIILVVMLLEWSGGAFENTSVLYDLGGLTHDVFARGQYWRLLAAMFLHANLLHWFANSFTLYQLGSLYEQMFGSGRFAVIYLVTGLCASVVSALRLPPGGVSVGASGAILGILGAFFFSIRRHPRWRHEKWTKGLLSQLAFWAIVNIALGFSVEVIDNAAHIAGMIAGLILGAVLPHRGVPPPPPGQVVIDVPPGESSPLPRNEP